MKELKGKVAAVTGAASGLGRAMALAFADEGMHVALADVADTSEVFAQVEARGVSALSMKLDVSRAEEVEAFAALVEKDLGPTALACNNAGVSVHGAAWENSVDDWRWVLGVNLWGVIHGVRSFVPRMRSRNAGHVVNTASVAGLLSPSGMAVYSVSKHAVVALSEVLHHDLRQFGSAVGVSVLCPAYVPTRIAESERNRPSGHVPGEKSPRTLERQAMLKKAVASGKLSADDVARAVVRAVKEERFYVLTHPAILGAVRARMEDVLGQRAPRDPMSLDEP
ncbi:MAG TPA: SDR family NAD(P)-dependent oxidoreductase [Burkholderiales bacterium]|nr:SDR family NAD(P)-dependent oxidoreductase [Burkholderiales bacterium]